MFLKALTLKGFKSFADKTTIDLEPGVTVVIGPNGSGKSNVVDAVAWVLGAQGARALRGAKMDDVIFAGTANRPALGRAEVSLTIDNTSGVLPIEFSEVTITRRLFRTGDSEYELNGAPCRLLDIQELLSDTGIGRQQHVIVGQGQLDAVLNARPEDRRSTIEEAAGILKYRKRKEKAERRLEATEANLLRLSDLLREVRRQLRPLERQAEAARRSEGLAAELRAARLHLAGRDIDRLTVRDERQRASRHEFAALDNDLRGRLRVLDEQVVEVERALTLPTDDDVADLLVRVEQLRERAKGVQALVGERLRNIDRELEAAADEGVVETLVADAAAARQELAALVRDVDALAPERVEVERAEAAVERARAELAGAHALAPELTDEGRERAAAEDDVEARSTALRDAEAEWGALARTNESLAAEEPELRAQLVAAARDIYGSSAERERVEEAEQTAEAARAALDEAAAHAPEQTAEGRALLAAEHALETATKRLNDARDDASRWHTRAETLTLALDAAHASAHSELVDALPGVVGPLIDHLDIEPGIETAVASALGDAVHAIVLDGTAAARAAVDRLRRGEGQALLLVLDARTQGPPPITLVPRGARLLVDAVRASRPALDAAVRRLLANVVLVHYWSDALDLALANPALVAVTPDGDRFGGASPWRAGPLGAPAVTTAARDEALARAEQAQVELTAAEASVRTARERLELAKAGERARAATLRDRRVEVDRAVGAAAIARQDLERRTAGLDERHASLERRIGELQARAGELPPAIEAAEAQRAEAEEALEQARMRLAAARRAELVRLDSARQAQAEVDRIQAEASALRRDFDVRAAAITERRDVLHRRLEEVERRLAARPDEEAAAQRRRDALTGRRSGVAALVDRLAALLVAADAQAGELRETRRVQTEAAREAGSRLDALRSERATVERELSETRERINRLEIEQAETKLRLETTIEQLRRDYDCEPDVALAAEPPDTIEGVTIAQHARDLERELRMLGPVNPLALSEYETLLERHEFLQSQLDDVKHSRRELHRVIQSVNAEIVTVFEQAFADVSKHFESLFALLFPGGSGRLFLSEPENLLDTGVEVEARPSGKTPRRLSLLSGGERSLAALAFLFAVFRARPSPFYLLDEVEAALDDVNLHRFLDLVQEFRNEAQLVIVSHQKRTMESADVLYGVSMAPGSSSRVVSQRIRDLELEDA
ncbi:MAG TPA: chromosome segregation protein SMC [Acidimicrobiia bacterium]